MRLKIFRKNIVFLFVLSVVVLRTLFTQGVPYTHDGHNHLARTANLYLAVRDQHFPPRWARNLNYKFGYPVFNFNYYFPFILTIPFFLISFSIEFAWKAVIFLSFFSGGVFIYLLLKKYFNRLASLTGAVFYVLAPYQMVNIFVRGMTGEIVAFGLLPLVLLSLDSFIRKRTRKGFIFISFLLAGFFLTHNIIVLISMPVILGFILIRSFLEKKRLKAFLSGLLSIVAAISLTLFFWLPALMEKKYTNLDFIDMSHFYQDHFPTIKQLVSSFWGYGFSKLGVGDGMSFSIGPLQFVLIACSILFYFFKLKKKKLKKPVRLMMGFFTAVFFFACFFMLEASTVLWQSIPFLNYVQFPWRLLFLTTLASAFIIGFLLNQVKKPVFGFVLIGGVVILTLPMTKPQYKFHYENYMYYEFLFTSSTKGENMPIWFENDNIEKLKQRFISDSGLVEFKEIEWKTSRHLYEINSLQEDAVVEQTAYFPGWKVFIDGKQTEIDYQQKDYPGLISFKIPSGKHLVKTVFTEDTWARKIGDIISGLTFLSLSILFIVDWGKEHAKRK